MIPSIGSSSVRTTIVDIPTAEIADWITFHRVFAAALRFPDYYGGNMNAWIDCLTYADDADAGMLGPAVQPGEILTLRIADAASFKRRCPEQYDALIESAAFVNYRRVEVGETPVLALLIEGWFASS